MIRRICIFLVAAGAALLFFHRETILPTLPVPPAGRLVKDVAEIGSEGDYYVRVTMPKIDDSVGLSEETVPCSFVVSITESGKPTLKMEISSLTRSSEYGFGRTQDYHDGNKFRLKRGEHVFEVSCRETCVVAAARGATISLEQDVGNPTNYYFRNLLRSWCTTGALCVGLIGIVICEFKKPNQGPSGSR